MLTLISKKLNDNLYQLRLIDEDNTTILEEMVDKKSKIESIKKIAEDYYVSDIKHYDDSKKVIKDTEISIIPYTNEFDLHNYFERENLFIFDRILTAIEDGIVNKKKKIKLFRFDKTNVYLTSSKKNWLSGLLITKKYLEKYEFFEKIPKCQELIDALNTYK